MESVVDFFLQKATKENPSSLLDPLLSLVSSAKFTAISCGQSFDMNNNMYSLTISLPLYSLPLLIFV